VDGFLANDHIVTAGQDTPKAALPHDAVLAERPMQVARPDAADGQVRADGLDAPPLAAGAMKPSQVDRRDAGQAFQERPAVVGNNVGEVRDSRTLVATASVGHGFADCCLEIAEIM
jgi:hypothetical protein